MNVLNYVHNQTRGKLQFDATEKSQTTLSFASRSLEQVRKRVPYSNLTWLEWPLNQLQSLINLINLVYTYKARKKCYECWVLFW